MSLTASQKASVVWSALASSGANATYKPGDKPNPLRFYVHHPNGSILLWVYIWGLTPGGRNLGDEYRIQMTGVQSPLILNPIGPTVLLGYHEATNSFVGFDLQRHHQFKEGSSSVQAPFSVVQQAQEKGLSFGQKLNEEIVVGILPHHLLTYVLTAEELHKPANEFVTLGKHDVLSSGAGDASISALPPERKRVVREVSSLARASTFRRKVLEAYGYRCAFTGMQLDLLDAAHILPVAAPESSDEVANGIAATPTFHRAFDSGLIFLDDSYNVQLNDRLIEQLGGLGRLDGLSDLQRIAGSDIILPAAKAHHPDREMIRAGNAYRGVA